MVVSLKTLTVRVLTLQLGGNAIFSSILTLILPSILPSILVSTLISIPPSYQNHAVFALNIDWLLPMSIRSLHDRQCSDLLTSSVATSCRQSPRGIRGGCCASTVHPSHGI